MIIYHSHKMMTNMEWFGRARLCPAWQGRARFGTVW